MLKNKVRFIGSAIIAVMLFVSVFFTHAVSANPTILNVQPSRSAIGPGESVNISVRTNAQANYVFAMVDGVRFQGLMLGTDGAGNREWSVTAFPNWTTNIVIFANRTNLEAGAAQMNVPITVDFAAATVPPIGGVAPFGMQPGAVPQMIGIGPASIHNVWESAPIAAGMVQLTVVTGNQANFVWVQFDGNRTEQGRRVATDATSSTWTIDYRPGTFAPHTVTVFSSTTNTWSDADQRLHNVVLHQPFAGSVNPAFAGLPSPVIQTVTVTPREVSPGGNVTINIRTNAAVGAVWVRDVDGREWPAWSVLPTTATQRNWQAVITPTRTGSVTIFANHFHTPWGAVQRAENINVRAGRATVVSATARRITDWHWGFQADTHISVTTNRWANSVWAVLPNRQTIALTHISGTGTANRVWEVHTWGGALPITIHVSEAAGMVGGFSDATRTINTWTGAVTPPTPPAPWQPWPPPTGWPPQVCWTSMPWPVVPGTMASCGRCIFHGGGWWFNTVTGVLSHSPCGGWGGTAPGTGVNVAGAGWQYIQNGWHFNPNSGQSAWRGQGHGPPEWVNVHFNNRWYHMSRLGVMHPVSGGVPRTTTVVP